jgi:hypothetical protein
MAPKVLDSPSGPTLVVLADSFRRSLLAENKSPKTVMTYLDVIGDIGPQGQCQRSFASLLGRTQCKRWFTSESYPSTRDGRPRRRPDLRPRPAWLRLGGCELTPCVA